MVQKEDTRITFRLDQKSLEFVEKAAATGESISEVIRLAIKRYLIDYQEIKRDFNIIYSEQPSTDEKVERVNIRIETDILNELKRISDETGKSISRLVREAINWSLSDKITIQIPRKLFMEVHRLVDGAKQSRLDYGMQKSLDDYASSLRL